MKSERSSRRRHRERGEGNLKLISVLVVALILGYIAVRSVPTMVFSRCCSARPRRLSTDALVRPSRSNHQNRLLPSSRSGTALPRVETDSVTRRPASPNARLRSCSFSREGSRSSRAPISSSFRPQPRTHTRHMSMRKPTSRRAPAPRSSRWSTVS